MKKRFKEWGRKRLVYFKRNTRVLTFLLIVISCLVFTLKMSDHSQAVSLAPDRFSSAPTLFFAITLMSFMCIFAFVGFKKFNKKNLPSLIATVALLALQLVFSILMYTGFVDAASSNTSSYTEYFVETYKWMMVHIVFLSLSLISIPCLPLLTKLLSRIDTSPEDQKVARKAIDTIVDSADV